MGEGRSYGLWCKSPLLLTVPQQEQVILYERGPKDRSIDSLVTLNREINTMVENSLQYPAAFDLRRSSEVTPGPSSNAID